MKIFISWSGARSRAIAEALNDWLKRVIQAVKPFYSPEIEKGAKWSSEVDSALEDTRFGIICLTPDNLESRWIHYEAGALSKTPDAIIWTFLHGITPGDVPQPLGKFMATEANKNDVQKMLRAINKRLADIGGEPVDSVVLTENFELYWPKLEEKLRVAEQLSGQKLQLADGLSAEKQRDEREILLEILEIARSQQRVRGQRRVDAITVDTSQSMWIMGISLVTAPGEEYQELTSRVLDAVRQIHPTTLMQATHNPASRRIQILFESPQPESIARDITEQIVRRFSGSIRTAHILPYR